MPPSTSRPSTPPECIPLLTAGAPGCPGWAGSEAQGKGGALGGSWSAAPGGRRWELGWAHINHRIYSHIWLSPVSWLHLEMEILAHHKGHRKGLKCSLIIEPQPLQYQASVQPKVLSCMLNWDFPCVSIWLCQLFHRYLNNFSVTKCRQRPALFSTSETNFIEYREKCSQSKINMKFKYLQNVKLT